VLDNYLPSLTGAELKILLVIIRQTNGWVNRSNTGRKQRDRISHRQFICKTGLCSRIISQTLQKLTEKGLICVSNGDRELLHSSAARKGNPHLFFSLRLSHFSTSTTVKSVDSPPQKGAMYKTNYTKLNKTKLRERFNEVKSVSEVIANMAMLKKTLDTEDCVMDS